jgi:hypothetical protein
MDVWQPLSRRGGEASGAEALHEGVPAHLRPQLLQWLDGQFEHNSFMRAAAFAESERKAGRIAALLRLDLSEAPKSEARSDAATVVWCGSRALVYTCGQLARSLLFDVIDATLHEGVPASRAQELDQLLADGGSAWRVADDHTCLQRRVDAAAEMLFLHAADGNPATHLTAAWKAVHGRQLNASLAYSEAVKAVEAACLPVVSPGATGSQATLGSAIRVLNDHQHEWELVINWRDQPARIIPLLGMLRLLWHGQTDRHGGEEPTRPVTDEAAAAAVYLAVTLVRWFQTDVVRRRTVT